MIQVSRWALQPDHLRGRPAFHVEFSEGCVALSIISGLPVNLQRPERWYVVLCGATVF
jgi:hypothetical protein